METKYFKLDSDRVVAITFKVTAYGEYNALMPGIKEAFEEASALYYNKKEKEAHEILACPVKISATIIRMEFFDKSYSPAAFELPSLQTKKLLDAIHEIESVVKTASIADWVLEGQKASLKSHFITKLMEAYGEANG